jgi:hypothetical protein
MTTKDLPIVDVGPVARSAGWRPPAAVGTGAKHE